MPSAIEEARDSALRKIGRNVVNLQKMESMLRWFAMLAHGAVDEGTRSERLSKKFVQRLSMGRFVDAFERSMADGSAAVATRRSDSGTVSFTFQLEPGFDAERREALRGVVAERNRLIHA